MSAVLTNLNGEGADGGSALGSHAEEEQVDRCHGLRPRIAPKTPDPPGPVSEGKGLVRVLVPDMHIWREQKKKTESSDQVIW